MRERLVYQALISLPARTARVKGPGYEARVAGASEQPEVEGAELNGVELKGVALKEVELKGVELKAEYFGHYHSQKYSVLLQC